MANTEPTDPHERERRDHARYVIRYSDEEYRELLAELHAAWASWNTRYAGGRMIPPHIVLDGAGKALVKLERTTGSGCSMQISIAAGLAFGTNRNWVVNPFPAEGTRRCVFDCLLRGFTRQYCVEIQGIEDAGHRGFGTGFMAAANRIGLDLKLPPVATRRNGPEDQDTPVCTGWPHNVRLMVDPDYYGDDVTEQLLQAVTGKPIQRRVVEIPPNLGTWEYILYLLRENRKERLRLIANTQAGRLERLQNSRFPVLAKVETGKVEPDGTPIEGEIAFEPRWLRWENGLVRKMVEPIAAYRSYADLPILADALEDAGCNDGRILRHLRSPTTEHDSRCWVLQGLRDQLKKTEGTSS